MKNKFPKCNKDYMSASHGNLSTRSCKPQFIVIHYTACEAPAVNFGICFKREGSKAGASADFFVGNGRNGKADDGLIVKYNGSIPNKYSWHVGDGHGNYKVDGIAVRNSNSIGIEVVTNGKDFTDKQVESVRKLCLYYMEKYGLPASRVIRHYDGSRKACPKMYCGSATNDKKWKALHKKITE